VIIQEAPKAPQPGELYKNVQSRDPATPKPPTPPEE
jgi:hypothetical protein